MKTPKEYLINKYPQMKAMWDMTNVNDDWVAEQMLEYAKEYASQHTTPQPVSDEALLFTANRLDNGEPITGFFTKKKIGNLIVPVIERYREWDTGDYIESIEVDGSTLSALQQPEQPDPNNWTVDEIIEELKDIDAFKSAEYFFNRYSGQQPEQGKRCTCKHPNSTNRICNRCKKVKPILHYQPEQPKTESKEGECSHPINKRASVKSHGKDFCWECGKHIQPKEDKEVCENCNNTGEIEPNRAEAFTCPMCNNS